MSKPAPRPPTGALLTSVAVTLAVTTAYVHLTLGGVLFALNGVGYVGFAVLLIIGASNAHPIVVRFRWLPGVGLAAYAAITIVSYVVIGPHFALGWATKGVELALIGVVTADLISAYGSAGNVARAAADSLRYERRTS